MRLKGILKDREVIILIDSEANHNFLSSDLVQMLKLPVTVTSGYGVAMGNGLTVQGKGVCKGFLFLFRAWKW